MKKVNKIYSFFTLFAVGVVVLIFEIGGARVLAPFYGSTIFVWSALITITLGFLALGYFFGGYLADKYPQEKTFYGVVLLASIFALLLIKANRIILVFSDDFGFKYGPLVAALLLFALPLFFYSMAGPILIRLSSKDAEESGHVSGSVFAISTLGSLVGSLLIAYYLIPNFSLSAVMINSTLVIAVIAIIGMFLAKLAWWQMIGSAVIVITVYFLPIIDNVEDKGLTIIHEEPSFYADIKVARLKYADLLLMDGTAQSVFARNTNQVFANEALQINRQLLDKPDDTNILVLGFGVGSVTEVFDARFAIDYVELDPVMIKMAKEYFDYNLDDNDQMYIADARRYLREHDKKYDVIFVDLYHASVIPIHTHTKEALELMSSRLSVDGVLYVNILGDKKGELMQSLALTLNNVFPNTFFSSIKDGFTNILAYATNSEEYTPDFGARHKQISIAKDKAVLITDDRNPLDVLSSARLDEYLKGAKEVFGYKAMFAI